MSAIKDRDVHFHEEWLGLAQPIEGLVFSVPVLADAQIAPEIRPELSVAFDAHIDVVDGAPRLRGLESFFRGFLGYEQPGMLVGRGSLPEGLHFYAPEGGQDIRPTFALARGPFASDDPFAVFADPAAAAPAAPENDARPPFVALAWDLTEHGNGIDLDHPENATGPWRYPSTAKLERLLRATGIPVGFLSNGAELRLVYAPPGETTGHLTFRLRELRERAGRPILAALDLLLHARRAYGAQPAHTLEGLLAESRRRQADVTESLSRQVFEAVELLVTAFEQAAARDAAGDRLDWLRPAMEAEGDHFYQGVLAVVLRLVFLLYSEDQGLMPVEHPLYAEHLSLFGLYQRLSHDHGSHPESMHHRFGAYGQLLALFRAVFLGVQHGSLSLPPRRGHLFDPNTYPFLEGGQPDWTAAIVSAEDRAAVNTPSIDDGTIHDVLHRLVVFEGQRLSYRTLDVEQIGSIYESLMGYHVRRTESTAVRLRPYGVWVETDALVKMPASERTRFLKETCGLNPGPAAALETAIKAAGKNRQSLVDALSENTPGKRGDVERHRAAAGRLILQPGDERRRTGSHYTPRSLTEKVVRRTLEPLLACLGPQRTAEQILQLKICDPAMGSGAFLVATCRELAAELVAAWTRSGDLARIAEEHGDPLLHGRRLVAQKCLYGVDKNPAAVELAKLSLWLVTLSKPLPFTFVDHALRHGDSLVGLDFDQIRSFHWTPAKQLGFCDQLLKDALEQAVTLRQEIQALADHEDPASQSEKRRLFDFAQQAIERVRLVADVCVGAFFAADKDTAREKERLRRLTLVEQWLDAERRASSEAAGPRERLQELAAEIRARVSPFHWWIEFPEVFFEERPDPLQSGARNGAALMEGVVGNPPFGGKNTIIDGNVEGFLDWLKFVSPGAHGNSDLSAHFFRRARTLLGAHGTFGLVATNTIAQGDTRSTGLKPLLADGWKVYDATNSMPWPGSAAVTISLVHAGHGNVAEHLGACVLDGRPTPAINSRLRGKPERPDPRPLHANADTAFIGTYVLGMGFTLTPEERDRLVAKTKKNSQRIFPYLGGDEVNSSPTQENDRFAISFEDMSLEEAERWPDLLSVVRQRVKPERDKLKDNADGLHRKKFWWQFGRWTPALYSTIATLDRCLVTARTSKHIMFSFQPRGRIFSENLVVFALSGYTHFAILQSSLHGAWVVHESSTLETRQGYRPSDCFETFPFPKTDPKAVIPDIEPAGRRFYEGRAAFMIETQQGLTKTYNALKDPVCDEPRIVGLRTLHQEMDRAILAAYGWDDVEVPPFCPSTPAEREALQAFEDEVIDRLYVLNAERARDEEPPAPAGGGTARGKRSAVSETQGTLFRKPD